MSGEFRQWCLVIARFIRIISIFVEMQFSIIDDIKWFNIEIKVNITFSLYDAQIWSFIENLSTKLFQYYYWQRILTTKNVYFSQLKSDLRANFTLSIYKGLRSIYCLLWSIAVCCDRFSFSCHQFTVRCEMFCNIPMLVYFIKLWWTKLSKLFWFQSRTYRVQKSSVLARLRFSHHLKFLCHFCFQFSKFFS